MFQNSAFPKFLDPGSSRKKSEALFCNLKAIDDLNVNNNFLILRLCTILLIMHISHLPNYLFSSYEISQNCSIVAYKM